MHQKLNFLNLYTLTVQLVQPPQRLPLSYLAPPSTSFGAFSVRCHIEYIHSSKLLSPPSFTGGLAEWLKFVSNLAQIVQWGGERDFETIEMNFLSVSNVVFCILSY